MSRAPARHSTCQAGTALNLLCDDLCGWNKFRPNKMIRAYGSDM